MARRKKNDNESKGAHWMDTYGDMVTLLLTFFVLLYSFSTVNEQKWQELVAAFNRSYTTTPPIGEEMPPGMVGSGGGQSGFEENGEGEDDESTGEQPESKFVIPDMDPLYKGIKGYVIDSGLESVIHVSKQDLEIIIRFMDNVMFDSGSAKIKDDYLYILDYITNVLIQYDDEISMVRIEGHTDNRPIHTYQYPSNWELSVNRAVAVLKYMIEEKDYEPTRISAVGYGEYHPIADNDTESGRSKNRRVDFVITKTAVSVNQGEET